MTSNNNCGYDAFFPQSVVYHTVLRRWYRRGMFICPWVCLVSIWFMNRSQALDWQTKSELCACPWTSTCTPESPSWEMFPFTHWAPTVCQGRCQRNHGEQDKYDSVLPGLRVGEGDRHWPSTWCTMLEQCITETSDSVWKVREGSARRWYLSDAWRMRQRWVENSETYFFHLCIPV